MEHGTTTHGHPDDSIPSDLFLNEASGQLSTEIAVSLGFSKPKYSASSSFSSEGIGESNVSSAAGNSNGKGTNNNNHIHLFVFHRPLCGPSV
ncbi:hypothetical protein PG990_000360 [Apiospora arundinis]|uniref:Uncharacterized protein n=1 Tax=Apiospora arundinis TaxID=335852 RepID=A0ABR2HZ53_9PEZI